ncbi:unnamed protein product [Candidula unifasciata]|uniref:Bromo domain-containing protein n=1 Tax=Candidula unifasciata TaxID=100452 RepID=A0A8S3Z072_9EUPU|nr:unnamed protein product [Candidula unifasciata]
MVKTRHSGDIDTESPPTFISLNNEKSRHSLKSDDPSGGQSERSYGDRGDAYNIFDEKVVESRLRPRIGPSRAYNYIDVDSSDEEIIRRHHHFPVQAYSSERLRARYSRSEEMKNEMLDKQERPRRILRRQSSPHEDTEEQTTEEEDENGRGGRPRREKCLDRHDDKRKQRSSGRHRQLSLEENEDNESDRKSLRKRPRHSAEEDEDEITPSHNLRQHPTTEDDEHLIRRSSRTRRQIYDTLNQSYLVSIPGQSRHGSGDNNDQSDTKDQDSDDNQFSDMYSRVKRKRVQVKRNMYGVPVSDESDSEQDIAKRNKSNNNKGSHDEEGISEEDDDDAGENIKDESNVNRQAGKQKNLSLHKKQPEIVKSYSLREHKPRTDLYKAPVEERRIKRIHGSVFSGTQTKKIINQAYCSPAQKRTFRKRSAFHSSSSSTSSDSESSDEKSFNRRKARSMEKARSRMMPLNSNTSALPTASLIKDRVKAGASLADIEPMAIDRSVTFNSIGGLGKHIRALKEMIVFPLLYKQVFQRFKVDPPRGVLFYGPPGTGKTLVARALANECSQGSKRVAFFMRKGADCLSKWVGESERQLRLLFDQAYKFRPSIIFFDEIDGLAPVRSSRQDQIHSSIVSTLLALMDGLDSRGEIVVIGATNRIDSLDPALRRPGRFDREFLFHLPSLEARKQILKIHTAAWSPKLNDDFISELAEKCVGYCGADLKALCTEAAMLALRRRYPQIYLTDETLQLDVSSISVSAKDFFDAVNNIIPTSQRAVNTPARALPARVSPLLQRLLDRVLRQLCDIFPPCLAEAASTDAAVTASQAHTLAENGIIWDEFASDEDEDSPSIFVQPTSTKGSKVTKQNIEERPSTSHAKPTYLSFASSATSRPATFRPRMILVGKAGQGQSTYIAPAIVHKMENLPVHVLDLPTLYAVTAKTPEESCANVFHEAKRKCPSIIYMPYINQWWDVMGETLKAALLTLIQNLDPSLPLLLLATSEQPYHTLDHVLQSLFSQASNEVVQMTDPNMEERRAFFQDLLLRQAIRPPPQKKQAAQRMLEVLPKAAPPKPRELTEEELSLLVEKEELTLMELRIFLRDVLNKLGGDKKFSIFAKPVNVEDAADYYDIIEHPMDLSTMMGKIDLHEYTTVRAFMKDIDLICSNALEYNPNRGPMDRIIRHRACALKDTAYAIIKTDLDKDFEKACVDIEESRKRRDHKSTTVPNFYYTKPNGQHQLSCKSQSVTLSYLDNSKPSRSIPKPEGERFSRRVRGMNIDPVPPLEAVEKVYKMSRTGVSPSEEGKDEGHNEPGSAAPRGHTSSNAKGEKGCSSSATQLPLDRAHSNEEKTVVIAVHKLDEQKKMVASLSSSSKKKKNKCVWCKPRRKRPKFSIVRHSLNRVSGGEGAEDEMSHEEMNEETAAHDAHKTDSVQLVVDTTEPEESKEMRSPGRIFTRSRSPAHISPAATCSSRISTRQSSVSPRSIAAAHCSSTAQPQDHSNAPEPSKESEPMIVDEPAPSENKEQNSEKSVTDSIDVPSSNSDPLVQASPLVADLPERPKAMKRLDLESVTVDSGVGSSVDSNGDSRDSMDHRGEGDPGARAVSVFAGAEDFNQNCNKDLMNRASAILNEPTQKVVVDINRLVSLLNRLVARTDGYSVESLEKIYSHLSQVIFRHRHEYDKSAMISVLAQKVDELTHIEPLLKATSSSRPPTVKAD